MKNRLQEKLRTSGVKDAKPVTETDEKLASRQDIDEEINIGAMRIAQSITKYKAALGDKAHGAEAERLLAALDAMEVVFSDVNDEVPAGALSDMAEALNTLAAAFPAKRPTRRRGLSTLSSVLGMYRYI